MSQKYTLDFIKTKFEEKNCKLLDTTYENAHEKLHYIAACGHESYITWNNFRTGSGVVCPCCASTKKLYEEVRCEFDKRGCVLLSDKYYHSFDKLKYIAKCGHVHYITWANFSHGNGTLCPKCANMNVAGLNRIPISKALF